MRGIFPTHHTAYSKSAGKAVGFIALLGIAGTAIAVPALADQAQLAAAYSHLPLSFEANQGQAPPQVRFLAHGRGYGLFLTTKGAILSLRKPAAKRESTKTEAQETTVRMTLKGANTQAPITGLMPLPGKVNYLRGQDPQKWHTNISTYAKVKYEKVYPGIDVLYYGRQHQLEYDFIIAPGANPQTIQLTFTGAKDLRIDNRGQLVLTTAAGEVYLRKPTLYQQEARGVRRVVDGGYIRQGPHQVGFQVGAYDTSRPLVIDPVLSYATYLGGDDYEEGNGIAVDSFGQVYVTGKTYSSNFPATLTASQPIYGGGFDDTFVAKLNAAGNALVYATYLGGDDYEESNGIAIDSFGQAYVTGKTYSSDFPITLNALQSTANGNGDAFVVKLNATGNGLVYATYLGGSYTDKGLGIVVDPVGQAYVTGKTYSSDFPTTSNALQPIANSNGDVFVAKLNAAGNTLVYATYLGGSDYEEGESIAADSLGQAYLTGKTYSSDFPTTSNALQPASGGGADTFVAKLNAVGNTLIYATYLGGNHYDEGHSIAVDPHGQAYVTGITESADFPITQQAPQANFGGGYWDAFVTKLNTAGNGLVYSTYLGGSGGDEGYGIAVDLRGQAYVTGGTYSSDFPTTPNAPQPIFGGGYGDAFAAKLSQTGNKVVYSTYLGGNHYDEAHGIAIDLLGQAYVTGITESADFPITPNALQPTLGGNNDAFIAKFGFSQPNPNSRANLLRQN